MRILPLTALLFTVGLASTALYASKIYQWVDANGNTVFGDSPVDENMAAEIEILPVMTMPAYETEEQKAERKQREAAERLRLFNANKGDVEPESEQEDEEFKYTSFNVASPQDGDAIRANDGSVTIAFHLEPSLGPTDTVSIYLDGKRYSDNSKALTAHLMDLNRGEHSIFAVVKNKDGDVLLNSDTIRFNVLKYSKLLNRQ